MPKNELKPSNFFNPDTQLAALCLIACPGAEELAQKYELDQISTSKVAAQVIEELTRQRMNELRKE